LASATKLLKEEHRSIRAALDFAERMTSRIERGEEISPEALARLMEFIHLFVERCHHAKEEKIFFPALERKGVSTWGGPLGVMLADHERARDLIQEMNEAADAYNPAVAKSGERWARLAWDYSGLMQEHFGKEEEVLFRMADSVLTPEEQAAIVADFQRLEEESLGPGKHEELRARMSDLASQRT
jgi:hemerythrin-like domain-containing protein